MTIAHILYSQPKDSIPLDLHIPDFGWHLFPTVVATIYTILTLPSLLSIHTIKLRVEFLTEEATILEHPILAH
ncbi:hypothetical protein BU26DRAFT_267868 [Trematosphaeria pertusa]|uniref:Uncharacterized protein n=1 Tax=Trematosphaeria pertusa TaxID=390896 RepID=A0A6A6IKC7_9PLEO|nr:uncharacterized protein BU26DRAFT_267868 [Trematosphaeria pertusa]KAF2250647.1 hypothetical protein BU26DRAFT_267868 [Trematosphaeria pertusa]